MDLTIYLEGICTGAILALLGGAFTWQLGRIR